MSDCKRIVLIGPEATGKSTLAKQLADYYHATWIPEYARTYVENLNREYTFDDVVNIAKHQIIEEQSFAKSEKEIIFFDTDLIITKIWLTEVYHHCPDWIVAEIQKCNRFLYLLCYPDIEWIPDSVRENGGKRRFQLFDLYKKEIEKFGFRSQIVKGDWGVRLENAITAIEMTS